MRGALAVMMAFALGWVVSCSGEAPPREGAQGATAPATALGIRFGASDSAPVDLSTHGAGRVTVAVPCTKNSRWFSDRDHRRLGHDVSPGRARWYASVLTPGRVEPGDPVSVHSGG